LRDAARRFEQAFAVRIVPGPGDQRAHGRFGLGLAGAGHVSFGGRHGFDGLDAGIHL
jgi:DNA-binding helix-hairpin-helix protein with protein kinase domain